MRGARTCWSGLVSVSVDSRGSWLGTPALYEGKRQKAQGLSPGSQGLRPGSQGPGGWNRGLPDEPADVFEELGPRDLAAAQ